MAIDVERELEGIFRDGASGKVDELLSRILDGGSAAEFRRFLDCCMAVAKAARDRAEASGRLQDLLDPRMDLPYDIGHDSYERLLAPEWMARLEMRHLPWLCEILRRRYGSRWKTGLETLLADGRIAAEKRAALCGSIFDCEAFAIRKGRGFLPLPPLWYYNRDLRAQVMAVRRGAEHAAIRKIDVPRRGGSGCSAAMAEGVARDHFASFELNRAIEDRPIRATLPEELIRRDAARCFVGLLSHRPEELFELRSPAEWLLTVCRYAKEEFAVAALAELERNSPGLAARTRDPWGNTALWNTLVNPNPTEKLREELVRRGCGPDEKNSHGLSYRLVRDHTPEFPARRGR